MTGACLLAVVRKMVVGVGGMVTTVISRRL